MVTHMQHVDQQDKLRQERLKAFHALIKADNKTLEDKQKALREFSADDIGQENWLVGLVSLLKHNTNEDILEKVIKQLGQYLKHPDPFYVLAIISGAIRQKVFFNNATLKYIFRAVLAAKLLKHPNPQVVKATSKLLEELTGYVLREYGHSFFAEFSILEIPELNQLIERSQSRDEKVDKIKKIIHFK